MANKIEVYLTRTDEDHLIDFLRDQFEVIVLRVLCFSEDQRVVESLAELGKYGTDLQVALTMPDLLNEIVIDVFPEGHRRIQTTDSPVIEFTRCSYLNPNKLKPGRVSYWPVGRSGKKRQSFQKWARRVLRQLTATLHLQRNPIESYLGAEALLLVEEGSLALSIW